MKTPRIVWLAAADARGHLARAHLARKLLSHRGIAVDIVTTHTEGQRFIEALGSPSTVLSPHYGVAFDTWQNMDRRRTEATIVRYFLDPARGLTDLSRLREISAGAAYIVNDFHPLLLLAGETLGPVVHVYGATLYQAIAHHFEGRGPGALDRRFSGLVASLAARAYARIEHGLAAPEEGQFRRDDLTFVLPPLIHLPRRPREEVRASLGLTPKDRLAAVYLNPHFRDDRLARTLRDVLADRGYWVHAVGEGLADQRSFRAHDSDFASVACAADLLISAPGMASSAQARSFGVPFVALATDQPEQRANLAALADNPAVVPVDLLALLRRAPLDTGSLAGRDCPLRTALADAVDRASLARASAPLAPPSIDRLREVHNRWCSVLTGLVPTTVLPAQKPRRGLSHLLRTEV
ncbi:MAG: hypothetical protein R3B70_18925 [Polyangiaceae bacterium]